MKPNNSAFDAIMTRTSVRNFTDRKVDRSTVETILKAAMAAPSAMNKQPWHFFVISDRTLLEKIAANLEYGRQSLKTAPMAIIVAGDKDRFFESAESVDYWLEDCSASAENLLLAAHSLGLGAVWCGVYPIPSRVAQMRAAAGISDEFIPMCIIPLGYPDGEHRPQDKWDPSKITYLD